MTARYFKSDSFEGFLLAEAKNTNTSESPCYYVYVANVKMDGTLNWEQTYYSNPKGPDYIGKSFINTSRYTSCPNIYNDRATDMEILPGGKEAVVNAFCSFTYRCSAPDNFYGYPSSPGKFMGTDAVLKIDITNNGKGALKWCKTIGEMDGIDFNPTMVLSRDT